MDLSENKLESIPDSIGDLTNMTDLTLSHNFISSLPDTIGRLFILCVTLFYLVFM